MEVRVNSRTRLQAIRLGLQLAWKRGYEHKLEVETDCDEAVRLIYDHDLDLDKDHLGSVVRNCRKLLTQACVRINVPAVERCQNKCADRLAKVPIPQGKTSPHVWEKVSDLPNTHFNNVYEVYFADREIW